MKVEQKSEEAFAPITITLESKKEVALFRLIFSYGYSIPQKISEVDTYYDSNKIEKCMKDLKVYRSLEELSISDAACKEYFSKD